MIVYCAGGMHMDRLWECTLGHRYTKGSLHLPVSLVVIWHHFQQHFICKLTTTITTVCWKLQQNFSILFMLEILYKIQIGYYTKYYTNHQRFVGYIFFSTDKLISTIWLILMSAHFSPGMYCASVWKPLLSGTNWHSFEMHML